MKYRWEQQADTRQKGGKICQNRKFFVILRTDSSGRIAMETKTNSKKVALVLASGGARGMAHIGAIEELLARGYEITSIAGASIGAMIAGMYAAGKLEEAKAWFLQIDKQRILQMGDLSLSLNHVVKGEKVINELKKVVPDCQIEDLNIPCSIVASDMVNSEEVVFEKGSLWEAIRASISIPLFFQPITREKQVLIDGGILNPLPLDRVRRKDGDILAAMNISARDSMQVEEVKRPKLPKFLTEIPAVNKFLEDTHTTNLTPSVNYVSLLNRMTDMMIQHNTMLMTQLVHPDILAEMPQGAYSTFAFDQTAELIEHGRRLMREAIDRYEKSTVCG